MTLVEVQERARRMGINYRGKNKTELIYTIQLKEGYSCCFRLSNKTCFCENCCWRHDCLGISNGVRACHVFEVVE